MACYIFQQKKKALRYCEKVKMLLFVNGQSITKLVYEIH